MTHPHTPTHPSPTEPPQPLHPRPAPISHQETTAHHRQTAADLAALALRLREARVPGRHRQLPGADTGRHRNSPEHLPCDDLLHREGREVQRTRSVLSSIKTWVTTGQWPTE
ncbi:hypothetical protein [Actinocrispum sp. NPDC049592]|uniref:hypothetical protein n=1 Tax=Actinocrispum sp. NPDC049592 TaxID=3154835 RepID=UPI00342C6CCA